MNTQERLDFAHIAEANWAVTMGLTRKTAIIGWEAARKESAE